MSKRKIMTLALAICMVAILAIGGTLAYFTEAEQQTNIFTIGDIEIDLYETTEHKDGAGVTKTAGKIDLGKDTDANDNFTYEAIMPGDVMTKKVTVENTEEHDVYVSLAIKNNGYLNFNNNIDEVYENMTAEELEKLGFTGTTDEIMQAITDDIWSGTGWNLQYTKDDDHIVRYMMTGDQGEDKGYVIGYGYANSSATIQGVPYWNYAGSFFTNQLNYQGTEMDGNFDTLPVEANEHKRMWVIYLKLPAGATYTVDLTTTCPAYITSENIAAFDNMELEIQAAAIQADGFTNDEAGYTAAFTELHNTFGFDFDNNKE